MLRTHPIEGLRVERSHIEGGFGQELRPIEVVRRFFVDGTHSTVGRSVGQFKILVELGHSIVVAVVGIKNHTHIEVRQGVGVVWAQFDTAGEIAADAGSIEAILDSGHTEPELRVGGLGVTTGNMAHLLCRLMVAAGFIEAQGLIVCPGIGRTNLHSALGRQRVANRELGIENYACANHKQHLQPCGTLDFQFSIIYLQLVRVDYKVGVGPVTRILACNGAVGTRRELAMKALLHHIAYCIAQALDGDTAYHLVAECITEHGNGGALGDATGHKIKHRLLVELADSRAQRSPSSRLRPR